MPLVLLRVAAWAAQNVAVPVLEWALSGAWRAVRRHDLARESREKKKGVLPGMERTP